MLAYITNGKSVPIRITAVEVAMAATVELALVLSLAILVCYNFFFKKWVGVLFIIVYLVCLGFVLAAGLNAFGNFPF